MVDPSCDAPPCARQSGPAPWQPARLLSRLGRQAAETPERALNKSGPPDRCGQLAGPGADRRVRAKRRCRVQRSRGHADMLHGGGTLASRLLAYVCINAPFPSSRLRSAQHSALLRPTRCSRALCAGCRAWRGLPREAGAAASEVSSVKCTSVLARPDAGTVCIRYGAPERGQSRSRERSSRPRESSALPGPRGSRRSPGRDRALARPRGSAGCVALARCRCFSPRIGRRRRLRWQLARARLTPRARPARRWWRPRRCCARPR